jgi:hypothetical protein
LLDLYSLVGGCESWKHLKKAQLERMVAMQYQEKQQQEEMQFLVLSASAVLSRRERGW